MKTPALAYEGKVLLLFELRPPAGITASEVEIGAKIDWLVCSPESCVPGDAQISLTLPVKDKADLARTAAAERIEAADLALPLSMPDAIFYVSKDEEEIVLEGEILDGVLPEGSLEGIRFYPDAQIMGLAAPQKIEREGNAIVIRGSENPLFFGDLPDETGVLIVFPDGKAIHAGGPMLEGGEEDSAAEEAVASSAGTSLAMTPEAEAAIEKLSARGWVTLGGAQSGDASASESKEGTSLVVMTLFAFLGGMILNLMPCVFPVLAIKILGFVKQAGEEPGEIRKHGLVFALGVLISLWTLVCVMLVLKRVLGSDVGWGFQLQNPYFVLGMIALLFLFGLSLSGVFEFGTSLASVGGGLAHRQGVSGSFFSGVLAILLATPCTGPFMAPAIAFAFKQPAALTFLVFTALGLGLALPYVILSFVPALIQKLPKPGAWMETFKQAMAFLLYATAAWLAVVFGNLTGVGGMSKLLFGAVIGALGVWAYGRFATPIRSKGTQWTAKIAALALVGGFLWLGIQGAKERPPASNLATAEKYGVTWDLLSAGTLPAIMEQGAKGKTVFIDFTAHW